MDFCAYFKKIAKDPSKAAPVISVKDFLKARQHILVCEPCRELVDQVLESIPQDDSPKFSGN